MTTLDVYCLSGLGADARAFRNLDFTGYRVHHVAWEKPVRNESIAHYAARISRHIASQNPVLIGLSFGGIMS
jgi:hypothetical protein